MISAGKHMAVCRSIQFGTTRSGTEQAAVEFEIVGGSDAGSSITWYAYFSDRALKRSLESLMHTGWDGVDLTALPSLADQGKLDREVQLVIEPEEYNGKTTNKVKWVNAPGGGGGRVKLEKPLEADGLRALAERIKNGGPAPAPNPPSGGGYEPAGNYGGEPPDDGIPFLVNDISADFPLRHLRGWP